MSSCNPGWLAPVRTLICIFTILILTGCMPVEAENSAVTPAPTVVEASLQPPTEAPVATADPHATATPVLPEGFYATQEAASQATIEARATASPFPTAIPGTVIQGQPASALGERGGLQLEIRLPKDSYLAGEGGLAEVQVRNDGTETVFIYGGHELASLVLLDEQGRQTAGWPFSFGEHRIGVPYLQKLSPGETLSGTLQFKVPTAERYPAAYLYLGAWTQFSRPAPDNSDNADNLWLRLEAGPVALKVQKPGPAGRLEVDWQIQRDSWRLSVKDAEGRVPPGPFWGEVFAASPDSSCTISITGDQTKPGEWAGTWEGCELPKDSQVIAGGWIATEGYLTEEFSWALPGEGDARQMLDRPPDVPAWESYPDLQSAQATLDFPIMALSPLLEGSSLADVQIQRPREGGSSWTIVEQQVRLADGSRMILAQAAAPAGQENAGWGRARSEEEANQVAVQGETGFGIQQFGWWYLDWQVGAISYELRAPVAWGSLEDLIDVANRLGED